MSPALLFSLVAVVAYSALLVIVFRRGLGLRVHQLFALYLGSMLLWQASYIIVSLSRTVQTALLGYQLSSAAATAQFILFAFFVRALLRIRERPLFVAIGILIWLTTSLAALTDRAHFIVGIQRSPVTGLFVPEYGPLIALVAGSTLTFLGVGVFSLVQGYRQASLPIERNRLRYLLLAMLIIVVGSFANLVPALVAYPVDVLANIVSALLFSYAILRYQLLDITLVVRRGLAYSLLTATIATVYLLSILLFERLVRAASAYGYLVPVILAMLAALLLQPWRDRAQAWVDRLLFRAKYDAQRMLQKMSQQVAAINDLETLGNLLLAEICESMQLESAALFLREGEKGSFYIAMAHNSVPDLMGLQLGPDQPIVSWLQQSERLLGIQELDMMPQFRSLWSEEREELARLGAKLFVPLLVKRNLVGILAVGGKLSGEAFTPEDEATLTALANQTAVAVENARLLASTKARVAELTTLREIGVRLASSLPLTQVLEVVAESGVRLLHADEGHIALLDPAHEQAVSDERCFAPNTECTLGWSTIAAIPVRRAAVSGAPVLVPDLRLDPDIPPAVARQSQVLAVAAYPLRRGDTVSGVLAVGYREARGFSEADLRLLGMLADQATLAIENAQLIESERAKRRLADTLRDVSRVMSSTLELEPLLELVLEQLQNVVHYDSAAILLLKDGQLELSNARGNGDLADLGFLQTIQGMLLRELARDRQPLVAKDLRQDVRWAATLPTHVALRALIGVPLAVRDEARGLLLIGRADAGTYTEDDVQNAATFANQVALAIENARLYQETIAQKTKTETILREALSGILVTDEELRVVTFNTGAEAITGLSADRVLGRRLPDLFGPEISSPSSALAVAMATGERVAAQETVIETASGLRDILLGAVALRDANHNLFGYLLSFADITRLKEVDRLKTDIVANVSHELRTPLASIKAYNELLLANIEGEDRTMRDQFLRVIDQETDRLSQLIGDLLNLSRLEAGRFEVQRVRLDLAEVLTEVTKQLEVLQRGRGVTLRAEVADGMPILSADREMMILIMKNLISNAIKFSHRGGEVSVRLWATPAGAQIQVSDKGIGISKDALPHLFQKFYRAKAASELGIEGTGLGLVLTKQAVEAHGGTINVESELGVGTTFTVSIPWQ
ncbi:MAG: GAF domain-containing protein [Anaerolineae bacterium]